MTIDKSRLLDSLLCYLPIMLRCHWRYYALYYNLSENKLFNQAWACDIWGVSVFSLFYQHSYTLAEFLITGDGLEFTYSCRCPLWKLQSYYWIEASSLMPWEEFFSLKTGLSYTEINSEAPCFMRTQSLVTDNHVP